MTEEDDEVRATTPEARTIGRRLVELRELWGVGQAELAEKMGVGLRTYARFESGERMPRADSLGGLARQGVNLAWLICGIGQPLAAQSDPTDLGLVEDVVAATEQYLQDTRRRLPPEKLAQLVVVLYEEMKGREHQPGKVADMARIKRLIDLAS